MFLLTASGGGMHSMLWMWIILLLCIYMIASMAVAGRTAGRTDEESVADDGVRMIPDGEQPPAIASVMDVRVATRQQGVGLFRGRLNMPADQALKKLESELGENAVPLIQQDDELGTAIVLMNRATDEAMLERPTRAWLHWLLFALTFVTTTYAGALHQGVNLWEQPGAFTVGLPYSIGLLLILGVHELGHYFTAKHHGLNVTPPFFIPIPFALRTFGAFIQMKSPTRNRRALFDVAVAGPLAGLVVAIPALLIGLQNSEVLPPETEVASGMLGHGTSAGSSILFALLSKIALGEQLQDGYLVQLSPLAFAGWLGLFITALNLMPIGQLDGGHMARAMFGRRVGETIGSVAMWSLFLLAIFVWPGLLFFALFIFFIAGRGTPPLNDITPISSGRQWIGYATFVILAMILIPLPHKFWQAADIYCPYL
ncbi:M50 family peptidase [Rhodopirellula baltica WH47]|uniref:M50 family peptidase n=1 Tax=Rhodopirellula baltica WH47 TaxID=991778 RepID=F2AZJ0_RHOBT|nr:M50 family peptidase [Rhodopirellula baltica WH47]